MPNCFSLARKSDLKSGPVSLTEIDKEICAHLGVMVHPTEYCAYWYIHIGLPLACGKSFAQIREKELEKPDEHTEVLVKIIDFLSENFVSDCWVKVGKG